MKKLLVAAFHPTEYDWGLRPWRRHSTVLAVAGSLYVALGLAYVLTEPTPSRESSLSIALTLMPLPAWGIVWILVGVLALISARWPPASETWGYSTLAGLSAWWATCYLMGVFLGAENQSVTGAFVWGLVAFLWWAIAGLWNPHPSMVYVDGHRAEES